jgi:hypothetical protein
MPRGPAFRALAVWGVIILLECVNGALRRLLLEPMVGVARGHQLGVLIGSAVVLTVSVLSVDVVRAKGPASSWRSAGSGRP